MIIEYKIDNGFKVYAIVYTSNNIMSTQKKKNK